MVVIHLPYRDNAKKLNALAVTWAIILWMVLENKPFSNAKHLMFDLCFFYFHLKYFLYYGIDWCSTMELIFTVYEIKTLSE